MSGLFVWPVGLDQPEFILHNPRVEQRQQLGQLGPAQPDLTLTVNIRVLRRSIGSRSR